MRISDNLMTNFPCADLNHQKMRNKMESVRRHTFSWLCDKYGVDDMSKHLLMGHSLGNNIERSVYGHRTFEELKTEINKIKVPEFK